MKTIRARTVVLMVALAALSVVAVPALLVAGRGVGDLQESQRGAHRDPNDDADARFHTSQANEDGWYDREKDGPAKLAKLKEVEARIDYTLSVTGAILSEPGRYDAATVAQAREKAAEARQLKSEFDARFRR